MEQHNRCDLAPKLAAWLSEYNAKVARWREKGGTFTIFNVRDGMAAMSRIMFPEKVDVPVIVDRLVGDSQIPVRVYDPEPEQDSPVLLYLHGGGHVAGTIDDFDAISRQLAVSSRHIVVTVGYRLAPEHPYPAGLDDAAAVLRRIHELLGSCGLNFSRRVRCVGDSAGGAITATLAHNSFYGMEVDKIGLIYPSTSYRSDLPSVAEFGVGYLLEKHQLDWYRSQYIAGHDPRDIAPLNLTMPASYPETLIISAGYCPLRDDALSYVEKLRQAGVAVTHLHYGDAIHAYLNLQMIMPEICARTYRDLAGFLNG